MRHRLFKTLFWSYVAFDLFIGGVCGGFLPLTSSEAAAQGPPPGPPVQLVSNKIWILPGQPNPQQVQSAQVNLSGNPGPQTYFYWVVSRYLVGNSLPAGPFVILNAANPLSASQFDVINWEILSDPGVTYDVLRTSTPVMPSGACGCAVATNVTSGPVNDQSNSLGAYTVTTLDPNTLNLTLTSEVQGAGSTHLILRLNGVQVTDLSVGGGATGPAGGALTGTYPNPTIANLATGGNPGPIPYVSAAGTLSEDTLFCLDATNHRVGIGTCAPGFSGLVVTDATTNGGEIKIASTLNNTAADLLISAAGLTSASLIASTAANCGTGTPCVRLLSGNSNPLTVGTSNTNQVWLQTTGELDIGSATAIGAAVKLSVSGDVKQIHSLAGGTAPTISSGAGTGATITGGDESGRVTVGTTPGNTIVVNLGQTYTNIPNCFGDDETQTGTKVTCTETTSQITLKLFTTSTGAAANFVASDIVKWRLGGY